MAKELAKLSLGQKAWLAGFIDGDGCIAIQKRKPQKASRMLSPTYIIAVFISNTNLKVLEEIKSWFNFGAIQKMKKNDGKNKTGYTLRFLQWDALEVILNVQKYLKVRRQQADLAIGLMLTKDEKKYPRIFLPSVSPDHPKYNQWKNLRSTYPSPEIQEYRDLLYNESRKLNHKGVIYV